uniref:Peritrophin-like protein n=1 Tax=Phlebotomus papatasi TaxID=29031 RepID=A8CAG2_PHLPP|nr:peritrophin-like protein [Phlebotomus papatasi]
MSPKKVILSISSLVILATFVVNVHCEEVVPGIPVQRRSTRQTVFASRAAGPGATCGNTFGPKCKDCRTLMKCLGADPPVSSQSCAERNPNTPYCTKTYCSATPDDSNPSCKDPQKSDFTCTGEGYFPDPDQCTRYYICPGPLQDAVAYDCPTNYVYKSKERGCGRRVNALDCATVDCSKTPNEFGVYKNDPAYYYFCLSDKNTKKTVVMKCLDEVNSQYDPNVGECTFRCSKEGKFVDVLDCTKYNVCYKVGSTFQVDSVQCPTGYFFDPVGSKCAKGACTPEVTTQPPAPSTTTTNAQSSSTTTTTQSSQGK